MNVNCSFKNRWKYRKVLSQYCDKNIKNGLKEGHYVMEGRSENSERQERSQKKEDNELVKSSTKK